MEAVNETRELPSPGIPCHSPSDASFSSSARTSTMSSSRSDMTLLGGRIPPAAKSKKKNTAPCCRLRLPTLSRFLADFTLGFADGLTVPFALTAGLSSLGRTQTVIYAGMAEICAGSISMGIGGYLAAKGEQAAASRSSEGGEAVDDDVMGGDEEKEAALGSADDDDDDDDGVVEEYLAPLSLRGDLRAAVEAHVRNQQDLVEALRTKARDNDNAEPGYGGRASSPVMVGLSISIGYLLGGLLPLFPYFFVSQVGDGLRWSFGVCLLALFLFGFTKHYLLQDNTTPQQHRRHPQRRNGEAQWKRVRASLWEGAQMVVLGSIAAVTAVLAVQALEGLASRD